MAILKKLNAGECLESVQEPSRSPGWPILTPTAGVEIKALLTELGELPPNENDRLIDTRSEIPGETLGILVSTHPNVMAAFAANDAFQQAEASGRHIRTKIVTLKGRLDVGQPVQPAHLAESK